VFNASCAQSSFWPLLEHPVSHPITGITLALIAFYSSKRLNRWLVSKSLKAHAAATAGEEEGSTD
jgi:hypothetical protein